MSFDGFTVFSIAFFVVWALIMIKTLRRATQEHWGDVAVFGISFKKTPGEIDLGTVGRKSMFLRVHSMGATDPGKPVAGLDLVNRTFASYKVFYFWLTADQARILQNLLSRAIAESHQ